MKIDYKKRWGNDGTCYSQLVTIDKWIAEEFNNYLMNKKMEIDNHFFKNHCYSEYDLKIKSIDYLWQGLNYTNLIHRGVLLEVISELNKKGYNFPINKILDRNTLIKVI